MPRHYLMLVWPHRGYQPPPDLSRPELRAAFDAGRASRGNEDDREGEIERWHELPKQGWPATQAYWAGRREDIGAPMPLALASAHIAIFAAALDVMQRHRRLRYRLGAAIVFAADAAVSMRTIRRPRGSALGLTLETAPTMSAPTSMLIQAHIDAIYVLWSWRREGVRMRPAPMVAAAAVTRVLMRRRSWHEAARRT